MIESTPENLEVNEAEHWMSEISIVQMGIIYIYMCILTAVYFFKKSVLEWSCFHRQGVLLPAQHSLRAAVGAAA